MSPLVVPPVRLADLMNHEIPVEYDDEESWWVVPVASWPGCLRGRYVVYDT